MGTAPAAYRGLPLGLFSRNWLYKIKLPRGHPLRAGLLPPCCTLQVYLRCQATKQGIYAALSLRCSMDGKDLNYAPLKLLIKSIEDRTGLGESAAFLVWYLKNVYRLDD